MWDGEVEEETAYPSGRGGVALELVGVAEEEGEEYCCGSSVSLVLVSAYDSKGSCLRIGKVLSDKLSRAPRMRTRSATASYGWSWPSFSAS